MGVRLTIVKKTKWILIEFAELQRSCYCVRAEGTFSLEWTGGGGGFTLPGKSTLAFAMILEARNLTCQHETANGVVPSTFREMSNVHFAW